MVSIQSTQWQQSIRIALVIGLMAFLQSCVSVPAIKPAQSAASKALYLKHQQEIAAIQQFSLQGRIGVQSENKGFSGGLTWQHDNANDDISLFSPLGGQVASIKKTATQVTLVDDKGNSISEVDAETLTQKTLGWQLPLSGLADWALGRPTSSHIMNSAWDEQGYLITLKQDGWDIKYENYSEQNGRLIPRKILLKNEKIHLKLLIEHWGNMN